MQTYLHNIELGVLTFPVIAFLMSLPYALYQYRRYGSIPVWKTLLVFAFAFYCLCALYMVVLPLPESRSALPSYSVSPQLEPFHFIEVIRQTTPFDLDDASTWVATLKTPYVYETLLNVMLTLPLGAFAAYLLRLRWWQTVLLGFGASLFFEVTQLTGIYGIYEHPYRLFDVDDLITNTAGAVIGYLLALPFCYLLPSIDEVNERAFEKGGAGVSATRRLAGFTVDVLAVITLSFAFALAVDASAVIALAKDCVESLRDLRSGSLRIAATGLLGSLSDGVLLLLPQLVALSVASFMVVPAISKGRTLGQALTKVRVVRADGSPIAWYSCLVRYGLLGLVLVAPLTAVLLFPSEVLDLAASGVNALEAAGAHGLDASDALDAVSENVRAMALEGVTASSLLQLIAVLYATWGLTMLARCIASAFGYPLVMLNEVISDTRIVPDRGFADETEHYESSGQTVPLPHRMR